MSRSDATQVVDVDRRWWKEAVVYQVYPKSFADSDGDGVGDLQGLRERVDYLDDLGVDAVWLNPVYESPQADNGYDISDYRAIADAYGDMADWEALLADLHDRDIRLIMDLVVNHTSDEHEWFQRSRRREGEYADYYHWREGHPDEPPNNWESVFGGPAWTYDDERGEWYLHLFDEKQPDLNWRNPDVREDVYEMMRWWLDRGIDGFRMDVINLVSKTEGLPDGDPHAGLTGASHFFDGPRLEEYLAEMREAVFDRYDRDLLLVGETPGVSVDDADTFLDPDAGDFSMIFQFEHVEVGRDDGKWHAEDYSLVEFKETLAKWQTELDGWNSVYLNNHDQPRMVSRFGDDGEYRRESAKLLATLTHTLGGTPFVYQGEEVGMTNAPFESRAEIRDVEAENFVDEAVESGDADSFADVRPAIERASRDNARTPMQWTDGPNAGFTDGDPWIKVNPNYESVNVERARADPDSVWHHYRELIDLRDERDVLVYGDFELLAPEHPSLFAYERTLGTERAVVALNVDDEPTTVPFPAEADGLELVVATDDAPGDPGESLTLAPYGARVYLTPQQ